jgi:hypothetical protein
MRSVLHAEEQCSDNTDHALALRHPLLLRLQVASRVFAGIQKAPVATEEDDLYIVRYVFHDCITNG